MATIVPIIIGVIKLLGKQNEFTHGMFWLVGSGG
jgi:hypothetical protein